MSSIVTRSIKKNQSITKTIKKNQIVTRPSSSNERQFEDAMSIDEEKQLMLTKLNTLISGTSQILKVSPLYNLETTQEAFSKYAKRLNKTLRLHLSQFESNVLKKFSCEFMQFPGNSEFLFLTVFVKTRSDNEQTRQIAFMGLFFSIGSTGIHTKHLINVKNCLNMPSFLYNGPTRMWRVLEPELVQMFSCSFMFHDFKPMNMKYLAAIWVIHAVQSNLIEIRHLEIKISYSKYMNGLHQSLFDVVVSVEPFVEKWRKMLNENSEPRELVKTIWLDIASSLEVDLSNISLHKIASKSFIISKEGQFRLRIDDTREVIMNILSGLTRDLELDRMA